MQELPLSPGVARFEGFEADPRAGELRKQGRKIKLQEKPFQLLCTLLQHPGEVVTREELRERLWPADTFVVFDDNLNTAIKKLREALGDSADNPRFVETLPRHGYRFIAPVEELGPAQAGEALAVPAPRARVRRVWVGALAGAALLAVLVGLNVGGWRERFFGTSPKPIRSLAVLPLENLSGDPEQEYFVDGMTEALITELGKISALRVISRQSVMQFKGTDKPLPEIARELNVDAVVEGAVVRDGDQVRITAQLIAAAPERHMWAQSYERNLSDIVALQGEVARAIASEIKVAVTPEEEARLATARPVNPEAHRLYLLGRFYWNKRNEKAFGKALDYFEQAIATDPDYAPAYAGLADVHFQFLSNLAKGRAAAMKALEIDPLLGEAHASLGFHASSDEWDWTDAEQHFRRAIELSPNYTFAHAWYGWHLLWFGRFDEALNKTQRALELDPLNIVINQMMGQTYYYMRDYEEAIKWLKKTIEMDPTQNWPHLYLCLAYLEVGRNQEAIEELREADALDNHPLPLAAEARAHAAMGKVGEAHKLIERIKEMGERNEEFGAAFPSYSIAQGYVALGQLDRAFEWLERAYRERGSYMQKIGVDPAMDPLRDDPRFQSLLRRMNFPP